MVKNLTAMQETWVQSLGQNIPWRREWQHTPVFFPGEFHGERSLVGYSPWGHRVGHDWVTNTHTHTHTHTHVNYTTIKMEKMQVSSAHFSCSVVSDSLRPMDYSMLGFPVHHQLPELAQTHVHWVGDAIQPSYLLLSPPSAFKPSSIRAFSNESVLYIRWPKYWSFSFSISPSNEYSGLISFRIDLMDLLAVQGTLKSLLQHY